MWLFEHRSLLELLQFCFWWEIFFPCFTVPCGLPLHDWPLCFVNGSNSDVTFIHLSFRGVLYTLTDFIDALLFLMKLWMPFFDLLFVAHIPQGHYYGIPELCDALRSQWSRHGCLTWKVTAGLLRLCTSWSILICTSIFSTFRSWIELWAGVNGGSRKRVLLSY